MVSHTVARNQTQKIDVNIQNQGNPANIGLTPLVLYTCPAGKIAKVTSFKARCTGLGAGTEFYQRAKGQRLRETTSGAETSMFEVAGNGIRLVAGETIDLAGNSAADNESAFFDIAVQELPA